jgi:SAM-dependent methyltransferase
MPRSWIDPIRTYWVRTGHRRRLTRMIAPRIAELRGAVLDIGGGRDAPHDTSWMEMAWRVRVDISPAHHPHVLADALSLPFRSSTIDAVVIVETLEHVPNPAQAIAEAYRVLKPGGIIVGSAPLTWPVHGDPHDYFRFTADGLRQLLSPFTGSDVHPIGNHLSCAWAILASRSRVLRVLNPLMRQLGTRGDDRCPEGYVFTARKRRTIVGENTNYPPCEETPPSSRSHGAQRTS